MMRYSSKLIAACAALALAGAAAYAQPAPPTNDAGLPQVKALTLMASAIPSSNLDRSIAFYTKGLGMTLGGRVEMGSVTEVPIMLPGGGSYLMLQQPKAAGTALTPRGPLNRIILNVPDLKALVARLSAAGYKINGTVRENAQYRVAIAMLQDPDGNYIELVQRLP
jgi:predicted enzyme related to lactoylglutathione lyase